MHEGRGPEERISPVVPRSAFVERWQLFSALQENQAGMSKQCMPCIANFTDKTTSGTSSKLFPTNNVLRYSRQIQLCVANQTTQNMKTLRKEGV